MFKKGCPTVPPKLKNVDLLDYNIISILHRLHSLYGFNVMCDKVFDAMYNIALNVTGHHLHFYLEGIIPPKEIEETLKLMPWTPGIFHVNIHYRYDVCMHDIHFISS